MPRRPGIIDRIPITATLRDYDAEQARPDVVAGLVLAAMLVPQGMAYAQLTGLPAITGVYTTIAALLAYAVFGPNRRLVLGPDSSLAPVIAAVILPLAAGDAPTAVVLASAMSILAGLVCIAAGNLNLGTITELLSKPIRVGYLNGIAVLIFTSQLPTALGFSVDAESTPELAVGTVEAVFGAEVGGVALMLSAASLAAIVLLNRVSRWRPGVLVAAVGSIAAVGLFDLAARGVETVGAVPAGLPPFTVPIVGLDVVPTLLGGAVAVALVSFADTGALSTATALSAGERVDPDSEIKALGAANVLSGLLQGFATSASSSRTAVAMAVGSRTQVTGLVAAAGVMLLMVAAPGAIALMPAPTLAAIVLSASFVLFDLDGWRWLLRVRRSEFLLSLATALAVLTVGVLAGLGVAVALSLMNFVRRAWRPHSTELGKVEGVAGYHDRARYPDARVTDGLLLLRYDAPLFFANAPDFGRVLQATLRETERRIDRVVVVGNAITDIDSTGAEILVNVLEDLERQDVTFAFAGLKDPVKDRLRAYGLYEQIGDDNFFPNTISAVEAQVRHDA